MSESSKEAETEDKDPPKSDPEKPKPESSPKSDPENPKPETSLKFDPEEPKAETTLDTDAQRDGKVAKRAKSEPMLTDQKPAEVEPPPFRQTKSMGVRGETEPEPEPDKVSSREKSQEEEASKEKPKGSSSLRRILAFTMTGFFDWNPSYLMQLRGIFNVVHVILGVIVIVLLGVNCQLRTFPNGPSEGFFCRPPETFLFVSSIAAFLTAAIYLFCCLLSKKTDALLFETSFEISYYVLYFVLLLTSSSALLISAINWGSERMMFGNDYDLTHAAAIIGLINSIVYGLGAVTFFISQRYHVYSSQSSTKV